MDLSGENRDDEIQEIEEIINKSPGENKPVPGADNKRAGNQKGDAASQRDTQRYCSGGIVL